MLNWIFLSAEDNLLILPMIFLFLEIHNYTLHKLVASLLCSWRAFCVWFYDFSPWFPLRSCGLYFLIYSYLVYLLILVYYLQNNCTWHTNTHWTKQGAERRKTHLPHSNKSFRYCGYRWPTLYLPFFFTNHKTWAIHTDTISYSGLNINGTQNGLECHFLFLYRFF